MKKQKAKRALLTLTSLMAICLTYGETRIAVGGLEYLLTGAYASVYGIANNNTDKIITIPSSIEYNNYTYTVNSLSNACFCNYYEDWNGKRRYYVEGVSYEGAPYCQFTSAQFTDASRRAKNCSYVKKIILPNSITAIESYSFSNMNITSVQLNERLDYINDHAFYLSNITSIIIPSTLKSFGSGVFSGCDMLRSIIYLGMVLPSNWTATSQTFIPSMTEYSKPSNSINNPSIIEMITFSQTNFPYTGKAPNPSWTNNMQGYSVNLAMQTLNSEVGIHGIVIPATFTKDGESFTAYIPYKYTIEPAKLKAKVNNISRTYGDANPNFAITYSGFINGDNESVLTSKPTASTTATRTSNVGTYPITISGGSAYNYTIEYEQGTLSVNKAPLSVQIMNSQKIYGNNNPTFRLEYSGLKNGETVPEWVITPQFSTLATKESGVGTYSVNVTCEPRNYSITSNTSGILTISKAPLSIKVEDATMLYCGAMPTFSYTYSGFVNGDNISSLSTMPSVSTYATENSNSGTYSITPIGAVANNYNITNIPGTLTIKQRPLTVIANSTSRLYGETNPTFTVSYEGFVNNETKAVLSVIPTVSTTATLQSNAGTYDLRVSGGRATNYLLTYQSGQLMVMPRPLKASVGDYERSYGQDNPTFTIIYDGLVGNDTENSLTTKPTIRTSATRASNVGTYSIEVTGGYSPNYTLSYGSGTLTIVKAEQALEWNQDLSDLKVDQQVELCAKASSNLPVTYIMEPNNYAEIYSAGSKTYMECKLPGKYVVKAVQNGNDNYYSTQRISKEAIIVGDNNNNPNLFIKQADNGVISTQVIKGSTYTFTVYAEDGWKIHSVSFNNEDVTYQLDSNNSFTTPAIHDNSTLTVVYEQEVPSDAASARLSQANVKVVDDGVVITNAEPGMRCTVYAANGQQVVSTVIVIGSRKITLAKGQVYVLTLGDRTLKFAL